MGTKFDDFLNEQLNDSEFKKEYDALESERKAIKNAIEKEKEKGA